MRSKKTLEIKLSPFEHIRRTNDSGNEYWSSRDLAKTLDYTNYRNFEQVIAKSRAACINSGQRVEDHFVDVTEVVDIGFTQRQVQSIFLSRYASYLIVQNSDPNKESVAIGQTYFAIQTQRQELTKQPFESLMKSVHQIYEIYDVLRGMSPLLPLNQTSLVFALLFYKRISDAALIDIPFGCHWIDAKASEDNNKLTMIVDNLRKILVNYNDPGEDLYAVLNALDIYSVCWKLETSTQHTIFSIVDKLDLSFNNFDPFEFDSAISSILDDALNKDRHNAGEYSNPAWLEQLLVKMLEPKSHEIISFPFCKTASIITAFVKAFQAASTSNDILRNPTASLNIQGMEINTLMWAFSKLRLTLLGGVALDISNANPFEVQPKLPSDVICFIPPFAYMLEKIPSSLFIGKEKVDLPKHRGEVWFILNALQQSSKTARIGVVVPIGFLFDHTLRKVRRVLLEEDYLDAIIELPDKCFFPRTSIKTVLLILNKSKSPERKNTIALGVTPTFDKKGNLASSDIDKIVGEFRSKSSSGKWIFVSKEDIQSQDYILTPSYFHEGIKNGFDALIQGKNGKRIDEICQVIRGRARRPIEDSSGLPFISTKDLSGEVTDPYLDFENVTLSKPEVPHQIITQKCLLVSLIGRVAKTTIYDPMRAYKFEVNELFDGILINNNIACIVPNEEIVDFEYLYYQLNTPEFAKQFNNLHGGLGIPNINIASIRSIIVPVPELIEQQRELTRQIKAALLIEANAKLEILKANLNVEEERQEAEFQIVRHLAHDLSPKLSSVDSVLKHLLHFIESRDLLKEPLQEQFYEGQSLEPVEEAISNARSNIFQMDKLIKETRKVITEEISREEFRNVKLRIFLEGLKKKYAGRQFTMAIDCGQVIQYEIHQTFFAEMIDNFVRNAEIHGFENMSDRTACRIVIGVTKRTSDIIIDSTFAPTKSVVTH